MPLISIVSPVYLGETLVPVLVERTRNELNTITSDFEIILVEDGSPDSGKGWEAIKKEAATDNRVKGIKLSRNFGQHYAITAGLDAACGHWVVVMDCDLQDKPSEIKKLYAKALEGFDIVLARREVRQDKGAKKFFSRQFYRMLGYLTGTKQDPTIANFGIYNIKVIEAIRSMREPIRYFPTMVRWVGFSNISINVEHGAREVGVTTYNFKKLMRLAMDIMLANSEKPIRLTIKLGLLLI